ncbi:ATP-binding protein [Rheinheimera sp. SA_1]|uniref:ATP-binding protein n=1 Tax=Rheinheimera sp. SA_1 TaxID=1827365 RepID=UPI000AF888D3|nr:winged helix-turn-helix domain-containing protein [Rheinheimera sp. SA_1]
MTNAFQFGAFLLCPSARILQYNGCNIRMGSRAFDILAALVSAQGDVLTLRELTQVAWPHSIVEESNVRVQVANIRRVLENCCADKRYIASVAGRGYSFVESVVLVSPQPVSALMQIPMPQQEIVGRQQCISELSELVLQHRLVTLVGAAGAGKTTLALRVAHELSQKLNEAAFFVDLSTVNCAETAEVALALAFGFKTSGADLLPGLLEFLATKKALVLLDNCEHLLAEITCICAQIMEKTTAIRILVTSREAFRAQHEFVYLVRPLLTPPQTAVLTAQQALLWPAIQLFMLRANEGGAQYHLNDVDAPDVAELCQRLDGNPHAIGLVASRVATYGIKGLAELLSNQFALHWQGRRDVCPRQQTVEAMIGWSHNLLAERDQQVLYRLAIFNGEFSIDAAVAVVSDVQNDTFAVNEAIANLADKFLVTVSFSHDQTQIRLFETTKAFALVRLSRHPDKDQIAYRHALYYAGQLRQFVGEQSISNQHDIRAKQIPEIGNIRAALKWSYTTGLDLGLASEISCMAAPLFLELSLLRESKSCCERALSLLPASHQATDTELSLLASLAITYYSAGDYDGEMTNVVERGLQLARLLQDMPSIFHFMAGLHLAMMANGRFEDSLLVAKQYANEALKCGDQHETVIMHWMLGSSEHFLGQQAVAAEHFATAQALVNRQPLRYFEAKERIVANLATARASWMMGQADIAVQQALAAIDDSRYHPDSFYLCATLCFPILLSNKLYALSEHLIQEMDNAASDYKMAVRHLVIHFLQGLLSHSKGEMTAAQFHLQHTVDMLVPPKMSVVRVDALQALAEALCSNDLQQQALCTIDEAINLAEKTGGIYNLADLFRTKVEVIMSMHEPDQAAVDELLRQALTCAQHQAATGWEQKIRFTMFRLHIPMKHSG